MSMSKAKLNSALDLTPPAEAVGDYIHIRMSGTTCTSGVELQEEMIVGEGDYIHIRNQQRTGRNNRSPLD